MFTERVTVTLILMRPVLYHKTSLYYACTLRKAIEIYKHINNFNRKEEGVKLYKIWSSMLHQHVDSRLSSINKVGINRDSLSVDDTWWTVVLPRALSAFASSPLMMSSADENKKLGESFTYWLWPISPEISYQLRNFKWS